MRADKDNTDNKPIGRLKPRKRKQYTCPLVGCSESTPRLKWHVLHSHAAGVFHEDLPADRKLSLRRFSALSIMAKAGHGNHAKVDNLVDTINRYNLIGDKWEILEHQESAMKEICYAVDSEVPTIFELQPMNSPACLIHWKSLMALLENLAPRVRENLRSSFPAPQGTGDSSTIEIAEEPERIMEQEAAPTRLAYDTHFHQDRLQWPLQLPQGTRFDETMAALGPVPEEHQVNLASCTAVFCVLDFYPSAERTTKLAKDGVSVAIGVHPRADSLTDEEKISLPQPLGILT